MSLTIYDIAKEANVSITTVSRVINSKEGVSDKARERVLAAIEHLNYQPSQLARGLANRSTKTVGIMAIDIREVHHASIVYQIEHTLSEGGYSAIVCNLGGKQERLGMYLDMLTSQQVEGIIFVGSVFAGEVCRKQLKLVDENTICVLVNAILPFPNCYGVLDSEEIAFTEAIDYLVKERKRKNIAFIYDEDNTISLKQKRQGYRAGMTRNGLSSNILEVKAEPRFEQSQEATREVIQKYPATDGIIYTNDLLAVGGVCMLQDAGKRIPEDVSVIGTNNSIYAKICRPALTSIDNHAEESGKAAAGLMLKILGGEEVLGPYVLPCEMKIRQSS